MLSKKAKDECRYNKMNKLCNDDMPHIFPIERQINESHLILYDNINLRFIKNEIILREAMIVCWGFLLFRSQKFYSKDNRSYRYWKLGRRGPLRHLIWLWLACKNICCKITDQNLDDYCFHLESIEHRKPVSGGEWPASLDLIRFSID